VSVFSLGLPRYLGSLRIAISYVVVVVLIAFRNSPKVENSKG
jgi:hypothetical protein